MNELQVKVKFKIFILVKENMNRVCISLNKEFYDKLVNTEGSIRNV